VIPRAPEPFFGREDQLTRLKAQLAENHLVVLKGIAGIGKTAVVLHLLRSLSDTVDCHYIRLSPGVGLQALFNELGAVSEAVGASAQALDLVKLMNRINPSGQTSCWVLEDFHCLDRSDAQALLRVLQAYLRNWVVITTREELPLPSLESVDIVQEKLSSLNQDSSVELLSHLLRRAGREVPSQESLQASCQSLNGHPFLLKLLASVWNEGTSPVAEFLMREVLQGLGAKPLSFLSCLSLSQLPLPQSVFANWDGADELQSLAQRFLVEGELNRWSVPRLISDQLQPASAQLAIETHAQLASHQESQGELEAALYHWQKANRPEQAAKLLERQASALISQGRYQTVLDCLKLIEDSGLKISAGLLQSYSFVLSNLGRWEDSLAVLRRLESFPDYASETLIARAGSLLNRGDWGAALADYRQSLDNPQLPADQRIKCVHYIVLLEAFRGQLQVARQLLDSNPLPEGMNPSHRHRIESLLNHFEGNPERAAELAQKAIEGACKLGARRQIGLSHQAHAEALCDLGQYHAARTAIHTALEWGRRVGDAQVLGFSYLTLGRIEYEAGQTLEAHAAWQESEMAFVSQGQRNGAAMAHIGLLRIKLDQGQFDEKNWQRCLKAAKECGNLSLEAQLQALLPNKKPAPVTVPAPVQATNSADDSLLRVQLFGNLVLEGPLGSLSERDWPTRKAAGLFALLCHAGKQGYSDQRLVTHFWPDSAEEQGRSSLRSAVHQVRTALKKVIQLSDSQGIQRSRKVGSVHLEIPMRLDISDQANLLASGEGAYLRQDYAAAIEALQQATNLYQGNFLDSFRDEWTDLPRQHYSQTALRVCHLLCLSYIAVKQGEAAEAAARQGLLLDNLSEELHMGLMEAFLVQGLKAEALRHYRNTLQLFETELSLYPRSFDSIFARLVM
jgi:DNA-binding SARP family transcriptional activator